MTDQPAGIPPFTKAMMLAEAGSALGAWVQGYTEPTDEQYAAGHIQRRVRLLTEGTDEEHGRLTVSVQGDGEPEQRYRITVTAERIPDA
jgi:phage terminase large subunit GpA-like protein